MFDVALSRLTQPTTAGVPSNCAKHTTCNQHTHSSLCPHPMSSSSMLEGMSPSSTAATSDAACVTVLASRPCLQVCVCAQQNTTGVEDSLRVDTSTRQALCCVAFALLSPTPTHS